VLHVPVEVVRIHEVNIQQEIKRHWSEISSYVISVLRTTGISDVEARSWPFSRGMEELSAMMYVNQFRREERYQRDRARLRSHRPSRCASSACRPRSTGT